MRAWLRGGASAASDAARRSDLWLAGALAEVVPLAWLPLLIAVAPVPSMSEITFRSVEFATAPGLGIRIAATASVGLGTLLLVRLVSAFGEAAVLRGRRAGPARGDTPAAVAADAGSIVVVEAIAFLPALAATAFLLFTGATVAPRVWQRPDIGGVDAVGRLAAALAPQLALVVVALLAGHAVAAVARRRVVAAPGGARRFVRAVARDTASRPVQLAALSLVALVARLAFVLGAAVLLRLLWEGIAERLPAGEPTAPAILPLLVGFVFAWLCLLAAAGALHVWLAGWWMETLGDRAARARTAGQGGARWTPRPSSS